MIPWYVCFLVGSIVALGFFVLGAILTNEKLRGKLKSEIGFWLKKRDDILRYLDTLRAIIDDKIVTDKKLAEHYKETDVSLAYINEGLVRQWKITKADLEALIWLISIK